MYLLLVVFISFGVACSTPPPRVHVKAHKSLGTVLELKPVRLDYVLENTGGRYLTIDFAKSSCGCGKIVTLDEVIQPGESGHVIIEYTPPKKLGSVDRRSNYVYLSTNDPDAPLLHLTFASETVRPLETIPPDDLVLGEVALEGNYAGRFEVLVYGDTVSVPPQITSLSGNTQVSISRLQEEALCRYDIEYSAYSDDSALLFRRKAPGSSEGFGPGFPSDCGHVFRVNRPFCTGRIGA